MSLTPLVSPAVTPPENSTNTAEYTVPEAYFRPLNSPAWFAQNEHQPASGPRNPTPISSSAERNRKINFTQPVEYFHEWRLFVSGLHPRLTETEVTRLFSKYGEVEECTIQRDEYTNESQGFCYVQMATAVQAIAATEGLNGQMIEGQTLGVEKDALTGRRARPVRPEVMTDLPSDTEVDQDEPLYCHCNRVSFGEMVACDAHDCEKEWFHLNCVGLKVAPKGNGKVYLFTQL